MRDNVMDAMKQRLQQVIGKDVMVGFSGEHASLSWHRGAVLGEGELYGFMLVDCGWLGIVNAHHSIIRQLPVKM